MWTPRDGGNHLLDRNQFLITLSTVLIAASGYIINDYFDVKIDLINKEGSPDKASEKLPDK